MLSTEAELKNIIQEYITDWKKIKEGNLLHKLELAAGKGKLAVGMKEVWKLASHHRGRLLVVENDFRHPAEFESNTDIIDKPEASDEKYYIQDAVDDVIEKVLKLNDNWKFTTDVTSR